MKSKPTLLIDMDGIFCDWIAGYYMTLEAKFPGARSWFPEIKNLAQFYVSDNLLDQRGQDVEKLICIDPELYAIAPPFPGAIGGMQRLRNYCAAAGVEFFICTAPHIANTYCYSQKAVWIKEQLGEPWLERLIITRDKSVIVGDVLLDDKPDPLGSQQPMWEHVLFSRSYNAKVKHKQRISDWSHDSLEILIDTTLRNYEANRLK